MTPSNGFHKSIRIAEKRGPMQACRKDTDRQHVTISIRLPGKPGDVDALRGWREVFEGLPEDELHTIEGIILDRTAFMRPTR